MIHDFNNHAMEKARIDNFGMEAVMNATVHESVSFNYMIEQKNLLEKVLTLPYLCEKCKANLAYHKSLIEKELEYLTNGDSES